MNIGFVVNDVATEKPQYTTTRLAMAAANAGHTPSMISVGALAHDPDGTVSARARGPVEGKRYRSLKSFIDDVQGIKGERARINVDDLDVLMLRNDPSDDATERPWAQTSGILFGQLAAANGVLVLNDPVHLADAINKTYFQHFPEEVRPRTLITRDADQIKDFVSDCGGQAVLKPLQGSGGQGVFLVNDDEAPNINQIVETLTRGGYVVAQEFLPATEKGDVRMFLMNGRPLEHNGEYAAFRRVNKTKDLRSNMHAGGKAEAAKVTPDMLRLASLVQPKLRQDGMYLVGLDIAGDKLMEVNVFSPGGLGSAQGLSGVDFATVIITDLERKLALRRSYGPRISNVAMATL